MTGQPHFGIFTRNGFEGPVSTLVRTQYSPEFLRADGDYTPHRIDSTRVDPALFGARGLPAPLLSGGDVQLCAWSVRHASPFIIRDVVADELHYVVSGSARLESDFGVLDLRSGDFVLIPRGVSYRFRDVEQLDLLVVMSEERLRIEPEHAPATLNPELHVDVPREYDNPVGQPGEYEVLIRHGDGVTSLFYGTDPLVTLAAGGAPCVQRFNLENVQGLSVATGSLPPPHILVGDAKRSLIYYLGSREVGQPPIHHNVDYDEIVVYAAGPGSWGSIDTPGEIIWTPKGIIHEGPNENVKESYVAWLIETRAPMRLTETGRAVSYLMETSNWNMHPSVADEAVR